MNLIITTLLTTLTFFSSQADALSCSAFTNKAETSALSRLKNIPKEDEFEYLQMMMRSVYDRSTFEFAVGKYEKYAILKDLELTDQDLRQIATRFVDYSFTHVPEQILRLARKILEEDSIENLSDDEKITLAYTYLFPKRNRGALSYLKAMTTLKVVNSSKSDWHQAEIFYMAGLYERSLDRLYSIKERDGDISPNTEDAIAAVIHKMNGGVFSDLALNSDFDNTQWEAFQP